MSPTSGVRGVAFAPHAKRPPARLKEPFPPLSSLRHERDELWDAALEPSSRDAYQRALRNWLAFTTAYLFDATPLPDSLSLFVTFRLRFAKPDSVRGELSGLAYHFKSIDLAAWEKARFSTEVSRSLIGGAKLHPSQVKQAVPIPLSLLTAFLSSSLSPASSFDDLLWAALAVTSFFTCARAQEVTSYDKPQYRNLLKYSRRDSLRSSPSGFSLHLPYHKADKLFTGTKLYFSSADSLSLLTLVRAYFSLRDKLFGTDGVAWLRGDGTTPTRRWFVDRLKDNLGGEFTGHSFRTGGATWYALRGAPAATIKKLGRWRGESWDDYVRFSPEVAIALRAREAAGPAFSPDPSLLPVFDDSPFLPFL